MYLALTKVDFSTLRKVLIVRNDRLGDVILTLPMAGQLKKHYPHLTIDFLAGRYSAPLASAHADINDVLILPEKLRDKAGYRELEARIREKKYDMVINVRCNSRVAKICYDAKIPVRLGRANKLYSWRFNWLVFQKRLKTNKHELDLNLELISPFIPAYSREKIEFGLSCSANASSQIEKFLMDQQIRKYTVIHPGSSGSALDLPLATYAKVIDQLDLPGAVILTGGPKEMALCEKLAGMVKRPVINAAGFFSLEQLIALLSHCELLLTNSTGPLHIARAFNRKVLGFYSTQNGCHPKRWGPYALEETHTCLPPNEEFVKTTYNKRQCAKNMKKISVKQIAVKLDKILAADELSVAEV